MRFNRFAVFARRIRAVPPELADKAVIPGMEGVRSFADLPDSIMVDSIFHSIEEEESAEFPRPADGTLNYTALAISGGADNGAYGAGLLKGWTEKGDRPIFKAVTGVSTGALIAPYAFLGSEYDKDIERIYTGVSTKNIIGGKNFLARFLGNSLASSKPLARLIAKNATDEIIDAIARAHSRGRRLFIGTTNLDSQRFVVWDAGAIAKYASGGNNKARKLFRKVLLASASIPVTLPPVFFNVEAEGKRYGEMHVDGGTIAQVFFIHTLTQSVRRVAAKKEFSLDKLKAKICVILNSSVNPRWKETGNWLGPIAERAINTMIESHALGNIYRIYGISTANRADFNLAYIPEDYVSDKKEFFDQKEMLRLFKRGYEDAISGRAWHLAPPDWKDMTGRE